MNIERQIVPLNSSADVNSSSVSHRVGKKKDLKNIVKNIVKIFLNWVEKELGNEGECKGVMEELLESHKYNNSLLKAMADNSITNKAFLTFLTIAGDELI